MSGSATGAQVLVVAKAPVAGRVKTRLGREIGMGPAAAVAAASLIDTVGACARTVGAARCHLALEGELAGALRGEEIAEAVDEWSVFGQRGDGLAERIVHAHLTVGRRSGGPVVQIGMDTPQVTPALLMAVIAALTSDDAVLGPAEDGGWWVLGLRQPRMSAALLSVGMSTTTTGYETRRALEQAGLSVVDTALLRDVDTRADAEAVAKLAPDSHFARAWADVEVAWPG